MRQDQLEKLPQYFGLYFDPETGKTYRDDGSDTGFTFERARWTGPFGLHFSWPWLNPLAFATHDTAFKVLQWAKTFAPPSLTLSLDEEQEDLGPFTRTVERKVAVSNGSRRADFSAGWLANSIIRNGERNAALSFQAEWRTNGFTF